MMSEPAFAEPVFADAEKALAEFDLLADEISQFEGMSRIDFEPFASASPGGEFNVVGIGPPLAVASFKSVMKAVNLTLPDSIQI